MPPKTSSSSLLLDAALDILIPTLVLVHLWVAPFTKVEESFNTQAVHDFLRFDVPYGAVGQEALAQFDHIEFPGAVPRTFVGALALSGLSQYLLPVGQWLGADQQSVVRGVLGLLNAASLAYFQRAVKQVYGKRVGIWFILLQASQFHVIYYASRLLPNMLAFPLTTIALSCFLPRRTGPDRGPLASYLLTLCAIILRIELVPLVALRLAIDLFLPSRPPLYAIQPYVIATLFAIPLAMTFDTYLWRSPAWLWPEVSSIFYNVVDGHASEWGVSHPLFYIYSAVPRLLLNPLASVLLIPIALFSKSTSIKSWPLLSWSGVQIASLSFIPHKEWRFIIYVMPLLTAAAALGADNIWSQRNRNNLSRALSAALACSIIGTLALATAMLMISSLNYPGGIALQTLHDFERIHRPCRNSTRLRVHMDSYACQTGITRFQQYEPEDSTKGYGDRVKHWWYDKTENPIVLKSKAFWERFDYAIVQDPEIPVGEGWKVVRRIKGFGGVRWGKKSVANGLLDGGEVQQDLSWLYKIQDTVDMLMKFVPVQRVPRIKMKELVFILEQDGRGDRATIEELGSTDEAGAVIRRGI